MLDEQGVTHLRPWLPQPVPQEFRSCREPLLAATALIAWFFSFEHSPASAALNGVDPESRYLNLPDEYRETEIIRPSLILAAAALYEKVGLFTEKVSFEGPDTDLQEP